MVLEVQSLESFFLDSEGDVRHFLVSQRFDLAEGFQTVVLEVQSLEFFFFSIQKVTLDISLFRSVWT